MVHVRFGWAGTGLLRDQLLRPITKLSAWIYRPAWRGASSVTLWREDGSGLRVFTRMIDVAPRCEVGVVNFELVHNSIEGEQFVDLENRFSGGVRVFCLSIWEFETTAESGLVLSGKDEVAIVAGAFPLTLALKGVEFGSQLFDPEYPWDDYTRAEI